MAVLAVDELRARVETAVSDPDLQALLDRIEAECKAAVGNPYTSAVATITETHEGGGRDLFLKRPVGTISSVTEYSSLDASTGTVITTSGYYAWPNQGRLQRLQSGGKWGARVVVVYVPQDDRHKWKEAEIDLARLALARAPMKAEAVADELSYTAPDNWEVEKRRVIRRLMFPGV
jgi:hypothetical protein